MTTPMRYLCPRLLGADFSIIDDAVLDVGFDGLISFVGARTEAPPNDVQTTQLVGLVMPGLVNTHCHTPMSIIRSAGDGLNLHDWLNTEIWPREGRLTDEGAYWGQALGMSEMLRSGVTTTCEMYLFENPVIAASQDIGARLLVTPGMIDALHGADFAGRVQEVVDLHSSWHRPADGVSVGFGPHAVYTLSDASLRLVVEAATELDAVFNIHLEETEAERASVIEATGMSATEYLADTGALEARFLAAHGVWLSASDMALIGESGGAVTHCPASNLKLGSGFADIVAWAEAGILGVIGTDGPASNDSLDLWYEMKVAPSLARGLRRDPGAVSATAALRMATVDGARSLGMDNVGALVAGFHADFVTVNLDDPALLPAVSDAELLTHLVFSGSGRAVTDVWVGGRHVVAEGIVTTIDQADITANIRRLAPTLL